MADSESIIVLGYFKGISKKSNEPFCMVHVAVPYGADAVGQQGNNYRMGSSGQDLFIPADKQHKVTDAIKGCIAVPKYKPTSAGARICDIDFVDPETGEIVS